MSAEDGRTGSASEFQNTVEPIEAASDSHSQSGDSGYDESLLSTASITSSVYAYEQQHGRTYHAGHLSEYKYAFPNDEPEQERLDIQYHGYRLTIANKIFHAPISSPTSVLDVGTGTGIWCMDIADAYPGANVIGMDISPIQPRNVPSNCSFEISNLEDPWTYADNRFDLVHTRIMNGFSLRSWPKFYAEAFRALKPGGWVENQEFDLAVTSDDNTIPEDSKFQQWLGYFEEGLQKVGLTGRCFPDQILQNMKDAGFVNTRVLRFKGPIGPWPKDKSLREGGLYNLVAMLEGIDGLSMRAFCEFLGWKENEVQVFNAHVKKELKNRRIHHFWPTFVFLGQKPEI